MAKFLDKTGLDTFWAKIKSTFQTLGNLATAWGSTPSDTKYPSEKLVKTSLDAKGPNVPSEATIATGDKPLIADSSDGNKVKRTSISFDAGVTNTFLRRNGTFAAVRERDLDWGGNFRTTKSPIETFTKQNSFFYPKPSAVKVEYSNNRTAETPTWTDYGLTDTQKQSLFSGNEWAMSIYCGAKQHVHPGYTGSAPYKDLSNDNVADQGLRITIACRSLSNRSADTDNWIYCYLRGILLYMSTQSAGGGAHCVVEKQNGTQYKADSSEWVTLGDYKIQGDSGWNSIPFDGAFGGGWTQTSNYSWVIRFTIWSDQLSATPNSSQTGCLMISAIAGINHIVWISTNPVQRTGLPFSYSYDGTMTLMKPLPIASGGTGATTAIGAEYNILNQVADIDTTIDGNRKIALCNQSKTATNGVFRWLKLSNVWTWIKGLLSSESGVNISGNAATATKATQDSDGNAINATYFKSSGNTTLVAGAATKIGTQNGADVKLTLPAHQDISGKMNTSASNAASGALQNLTSQLTEGTDAFTDGTEVFSSYASDSGFASTGHVNQPYRRKASAMWSYIKSKLGISSGKGGSDTPVYFNSSGEATACNEMLRKNGGNATDTCTNALLSALPNNWSATPSDNTYLIRRDTNGSASFGQVKFSTVWSYIKGKLSSDSSVDTNGTALSASRALGYTIDTFGNGTKRAQIGIANVDTGSAESSMSCIVRIDSVAGPGGLANSMTILVVLECRGSDRHIRAEIINNNNWTSSTMPVLVTFLSDNGTKMHVCVAIANTSNQLQDFTYTKTRVLPLCEPVNWSWTLATDSVSAYDFIHKCYYPNADTVDGYHINVGNSYSSSSDVISFY